ncbi:hypothetical protein BSL78_11025 [Apostichopus japonicus]|uniref:Uncharacterized protein n=1 Tax=Stichopus japonicus TaxID=307972 RepID=A0A2G8KVN9_STIJA|nr:hypothetical protein BSL78_11025 [Apostichopus japonicus]
MVKESKKTPKTTPKAANLRDGRVSKQSTKTKSKKVTKPAEKTEGAATRVLQPSNQEEGYRSTLDSPAPLPKRNAKGELVFPDAPEMSPNLTPREVLQAGSFGGTYFRPIKSGVTGEKYSGVWKELPKDWLEGLSIPKQVASSTYHADVNTYGVKCGGSLEMWESSGWINKQDPYGWFQWYCRFYLGRRTEDDERQISRWKKCAGVKGRWRNNLIGKCVRSGCSFDNNAISPVVRQTLQHWGYRLSKADFEKGAKRVK